MNFVDIPGGEECTENWTNRGIEMLKVPALNVATTVLDDCTLVVIYFFCIK